MQKPVTGFTLSGDVTQLLAPGTTAALNVKITNPFNYDILITQVTVTVQHATTKNGQPNPTCDGTTNLIVTRQFSGTSPLKVKSNRTVSLSDLGIPQSQWPQLLDAGPAHQPGRLQGRHHQVHVFSHRNKGKLMKRRLPRARWAIATAIAVSAGLMGGVAYGYWTSPGFGGGTATNASSRAIAVDALVAGDTPTSTLVPGGSADVILRIANPNTYAVHVDSVAANGSVTAVAGHAGCTTTGITFIPPTTPLSRQSRCLLVDRCWCTFPMPRV